MANQGAEKRMFTNVRLSVEAAEFLRVFADLGNLTLSDSVMHMSEQYPEVWEEVKRRRAMSEKFSQRIDRGERE